jgi:hypothetical protein
MDQGAKSHTFKEIYIDEVNKGSLIQHSDDVPRGRCQHPYLKRPNNTMWKHLKMTTTEPTQRLSRHERIRSTVDSGRGLRG